MNGLAQRDEPAKQSLQPRVRKQPQPDAVMHLTVFRGGASMQFSVATLAGCWSDLVSSAAWPSGAACGQHVCLLSYVIGGQAHDVIYTKWSALPALAGALLSDGGRPPACSQAGPHQHQRGRLLEPHVLQQQHRWALHSQPAFCL